MGKGNWVRAVLIGVGVPVGLSVVVVVVPPSLWLEVLGVGVVAAGAYAWRWRRRRRQASAGPSPVRSVVLPVDDRERHDEAVKTISVLTHPGRIPREVPTGDLVVEGVIGDPNGLLEAFGYRYSERGAFGAETEEPPRYRIAYSPPGSSWMVGEADPPPRSILAQIEVAMEAPPTRSPLLDPRVTAILVAAGVGLLVVWNTGAFDRALAGLGLNRHECVTNGYGATFCGDDAERYQREYQRQQDALECERDLMLYGGRPLSCARSGR